MITNRSKIFCLGAVLCGLAGNVVSAADTDIVVSPARRQEALEQAKKLLAIRTIAPVTVDPFHSEKFSEMVASLNHVPNTSAPTTAAVVTAPRSQRDILQAIAASLKPTGNFVLGGQQTLVFGQKRVKAGGFLTEYTLEIAAIERTSFTLRLNREEFTRPIK